MPQYMLLLRDDQKGMQKLSPDEMQKTLMKYLAWRALPFVVDGKRLEDQTGRILRKAAGEVGVTAGPFIESKEVLGGYYTIEAENYDEAVKLSLDHPHVDFGTIEIRQVFARPE